MANLRPVLIIGLLFLGYMIWVQWQQDYGPAPQAPTPAPSAATGQLDVPTPGGTTEPPSAEDLPAPIESYEAVDAGPASQPIAEAENLVKVRTDVLEVLIDPVGGTVQLRCRIQRHAGSSRARSDRLGLGAGRVC